MDSSDTVLTLETLGQTALPETPLAVLGHPVAHSLSPAMHNAALARMAVKTPRLARARYLKFDVPPERLAEALERLHAAGFAGLNLTIPHKVLAASLPVVRAGAAAAELGAVNTLKRAADGCWDGFNTDGYGLETALRQELDDGFAGRDVVLLGAGGAARAAAVQALRAGCRTLFLGNRDPGRLGELLDLLRSLGLDGRVHAFALAQPPVFPVGALVVNATSAGLKPGDPSAMAANDLPEDARVYDMIYNPAETPLMKAARSRGLRCANGLGMLVWQGAKALEIWTGEAVPADAMREAADRALGRV